MPRFPKAVLTTDSSPQFCMGGNLPSTTRTPVDSFVQHRTLRGERRPPGVQRPAFRDRVNRKVLGTLVPPNSITCRLQAYLGMLVPEGAKPETVKDQLFRRKAKDAGARSCGWARDAAPHAPFCSISGNAPPRPPSTEPQRRRLGKISLPSAPPSCLSS